MRYTFIKPDTFIGQYMASMENRETATAYDFWCAMWLLSLALGRNIGVNRPGAPVFLNMYLILCAESGSTRKSTAVEKVLKLAMQFLAEHDPHCNLFGAKITSTKFEERLSEQTRLHNTAHAAICISEMVTMLGRSSGSMDLPGLLTDLYDCPDIRGEGGSIGTGTRKLRDVYVSLITASTPTWLIRAINPDVIEGGFTSRCLFIVEERPKRPIAWPGDAASINNADIVQRMGEYRHTCMRIAAEHGGIGISQPARTRFTDWYEGRKQARDPYRASFAAREDHHILRTGALLAVNSDAWLIDTHHIDNAIRLVEDVREQGASLFAGGISTQRTALGVDRLRSVLIAAGKEGVSQTQLTISTRRFLTADQCRTLLAIMHELSLVQQFRVESERGAPKLIWRATQRITAQGVAVLVAEKAAQDQGVI